MIAVIGEDIPHGFGARLAARLRRWAHRLDDAFTLVVHGASEDVQSHAVQSTVAAMQYEVMVEHYRARGFASLVLREPGRIPDA